MHLAEERVVDAVRAAEDSVDPAARAEGGAVRVDPRFDRRRRKRPEAEEAATEIAGLQLGAVLGRVFASGDVDLGVSGRRGLDGGRRGSARGSQLEAIVARARGSPRDDLGEAQRECEQPGGVGRRGRPSRGGGQEPSVVDDDHLDLSVRIELDDDLMSIELPMKTLVLFAALRWPYMFLDSCDVHPKSTPYGNSPE